MKYKSEFKHGFTNPEAVVWTCSIKKLFLKIFENPQESTCTSVSFLIKLQVSGLQLYQKIDSGTVFFL